MALNLKVIFDGKNSKLKASAKESQSALEGVKTTALNVAKSVGAAYASYVSVGQIVDVTKRYQRLESQLKTATGTVKGQQEAFAVLQIFADETGQTVDSVTTSFTRLVNLGLDPSKEALLAYANVAAGTGKTTLDFVEAVADAATGEFERLKEFGIKSRNEGDTIKFTFAGVTTSVKNDAASIEKYLQKMGEVDFAGAVANQALTLEAQLNRAGSSWDRFVYAVAESGVSDVMADGLRQVVNVLDDMSDTLNSGELTAGLAAWAGQFTTASNDVNNALDSVNIDLNKSSLLAQAFGEEFLKFGSDAIQQFPANITTMVKILTVELASLVDVGSQYTQAFGQVIGTKLAQLVDKAGIYGKELADVLNPFDGDTFNMDAALAQSNKIADDLTDGYLSAADTKIKASRDARLATITDVLATRDANLAAYEEGKAQAAELRRLYTENQERLRQTDLGKFRKGGAAEGEKTDTGAGVNKSFDSLVESLKSEETKINESYAKRRQMILDNTVETSAARQTLLQQLDASYQQEILAGVGGVEQNYDLQIQQINTEYALRQQAILANTELNENARTALELELTRRRNSQIQALEAQKMSLILSSSEQIFGGLADIAKAAGGEQSKAYKAMFAIQKGFAIAQGIMNLSLAISNASAVPFPANIPLMAQAAATGAGLVSAIKGATLQGQAHDGIAKVPAANEGTWLLKKGEMVLNNKQRQNFEGLVNGGKGGGNVFNINPTYNIDASGAAAGVDERIAAQIAQANEQLRAELQQDFASNGTLAQSLRGQAA